MKREKLHQPDVRAGEPYLEWHYGHILDHWIWSVPIGRRLYERRFLYGSRKVKETRGNP